MVRSGARSRVGGDREKREEKGRVNEREMRRGSGVGRDGGVIKRAVAAGAVDGERRD